MISLIVPKLAAQECARKPRFCARKPRFCARMRKNFWLQDTIKIDLVWLILGATALNDTTLLGSSVICYDICCFSHGFIWNPQLLLQDFAGHWWNPINLAHWNMFFKKWAIKLFCEIKSMAFMAPPWAFNLPSGYCSAEYAFCRRSPRAYNIQIRHNMLLYYIMLTCLLFHHVLCYRIYYIVPSRCHMTCNQHIFYLLANMFFRACGVQNGEPNHPTGTASILGAYSHQRLRK